MKINERFARIKYYIERAMTYAALVNSSMILFIVLNNLQSKGLVFDLKIWFIPIIIMGIIVLIFIGLIDDRMKINRFQVQKNNEINPFVEKLMGRLDKIEDKIK